MKLTVNEIFYSLQGEGLRSGTPTIFIRLSGCNAVKLCEASGVVCDTEFESGRDWTLDEIESYISQFKAKDITWTGGEPTKQLTDEMVSYFKEKGYHQSIEASGIKKTPKDIDFVCISPKVAEHILERNFKDIHVHEIKYVRNITQDIPKPSIKADNYWLSPHADGSGINDYNMKHCIKLCLNNPQFKLSVQDHKLWNIQ